MFTDMGVKQRFPLPIALNIGCVMVPLFFLFNSPILFSPFCIVPFSLEGTVPHTWYVQKEG